MRYEVYNRELTMVRDKVWALVVGTFIDTRAMVRIMATTISTNWTICTRKVYRESKAGELRKVLIFSNIWFCILAGGMRLTVGGNRQENNGEVRFICCLK